MALDWRQGSLRDGLDCYRRRQFFEAHEHWELVWLLAEAPRKALLQALIQVAGAMHHAQRENRRGALSLLRKASLRLENAAPGLGIRIDLLREDIRVWIDGLERGTVSTHFPRIEPDC